MWFPGEKPGLVEAATMWTWTLRTKHEICVESTAFRAQQLITFGATTRLFPLGHSRLEEVFSFLEKVWIPDNLWEASIWQHFSRSILCSHWYADRMQTCVLSRQTQAPMFTRTCAQSALIWWYAFAAAWTWGCFPTHLGVSDDQCHGMLISSHWAQWGMYVVAFALNRGCAFVTLFLPVQDAETQVQKTFRSPGALLKWFVRCIVGWNRWEGGALHWAPV